MHNGTATTSAKRSTITKVHLKEDLVKARGDIKILEKTLKKRDAKIAELDAQIWSQKKEISKLQEEYSKLYRSSPKTAIPKPQSATKRDKMFIRFLADSNGKRVVPNLKKILPQHRISQTIIYYTSDLVNHLQKTEVLDDLVIIMVGTNDIRKENYTKCLQNLNRLSELRLKNVLVATIPFQAPNNHQPTDDLINVSRQYINQFISKNFKSINLEFPKGDGKKFISQDDGFHLNEDGVEFIIDKLISAIDAQTENHKPPTPQTENDVSEKSPKTPKEIADRHRQCTPKDCTPKFNLNMSTLEADPPTTPKTAKVVVEIEKDYIAHIVGERGTRLKQIHDNSGAKLELKKKGTAGEITISGDLDQIARAKQGIADTICERQRRNSNSNQINKPQAPQQEETNSQLMLQQQQQQFYQQQQILNQQFLQQQMNNMSFQPANQHTAAFYTHQPQASNTATCTTPSITTDKIGTSIVIVGTDVAGYVHGKSGKTIKDIGELTETKITTNPNRKRSEDMQLEITGTAVNIQKATDRINRKSRLARDSLNYEQDKSQKDCIYNINGYCKYGSNCMYKHTAHTIIRGRHPEQRREETRNDRSRSNHRGERESHSYPSNNRRR